MRCTERSIRDEFASGARRQAPAPLWYWNDDLTPAELAAQMREMRRGGIREFMIFPMAGLGCPYLSAAYFKAFRFTVRTARQLGMKVWIYDEYCWPSGTAGGRLNRDDPDCLMTACRFHRYPLAAGAPRVFSRPLPTGRVLCARAARRRGGRTIDLAPAIHGDELRWTAPGGAWDVEIAVIRPVDRVFDAATAARWAGNEPGYVDVMNREAMARFIAYVYEGHRRAAPSEFGRTVVGFFTDEPSVWFDVLFKGSRTSLRCNPTRDAWTALAAKSLALPDEPELYGLQRSLPWTRDMLAVFRERRGYDLLPRIWDLAHGGEENRRTCYDFFRLVSDLFAENYSGQIGAWCDAHHVAFTGHFTEGIGNGDLYKLLRPQHVPGIDLLGHMASVQVNRKLPRLARTAAKWNQRPRVACELYGASDWSLALAEKVQIADFATVAGIDFHVPIDYPYSLRSFRKHTSNPPGFFQSSFWPRQQAFGAHTGRLSLMAGTGASAARVAVLYPGEESISNAVADPTANLALDRRIDLALDQVANGQIEADLLFDTALVEGRVVGGWLRRGDAAYDTIVLPGLRLLSREAVRRLGVFVESGGRLIALHPIPSRLPGGEPLGGLWEAAFGVRLPRRIARRRELAVGRGRIVLVPDPAAAISASPSLWQGERIQPFGGCEALMRFSGAYPHWLAADLGRELTLGGVTVTLEDVETESAYEIQVSADGRHWSKAAAVACGRKPQKASGYDFRAGRLRTRLAGIRARHVRLWVVKGGPRFFGIRRIAISHRDEEGRLREWCPPGHHPRLMAELIPEAASPLRFVEGRAPALGLLWAVRLAGRHTIVNVLNDTDRERHLQALPPAGACVEHWDLDTGAIAAAGPGGGRGPFAVSFGRYEARVFVLSAAAGAGGRTPFPPLDRRRRVLRRLPGPWPFKPLRPNALALAACGLEMADPASPGAWLACERGRIPERLRRVPALLFRAAFRADRVEGDEALLFERGVYAALRVNGAPIPRAARNRYADAFGRSAPVAGLLRVGWNRVQGLYRPELYERDCRGAYYTSDRIQPTLDAYLLGRFSVRRNRLIRPVRRIGGRGWTRQGYPYFSGTGAYTVAIDVPRGGAVWLEAVPRKCACEFVVNGRKRPGRMTPPYLLDLTPFRGKRITVEILVTSPNAPFLSFQNGRLEDFGLKSVRLARPRVGSRRPGR